ncbi:MAG: C40 family peptidase [Geodermatophilaceae bacterium]
MTVVLLAEATQTRTEATALSAAADTAVAASQAAVAEIAARRADLEARINTYQDLFAQLSAEERELLAGGSAAAPQSDAAAVAVDRHLPARSSPRVRRPGSRSRPPTPSWATPTCGRADGPDAFDCSGLTMFSYAAAGVSLPHSSRMQSTMGVYVSRDELQPGDLIFTYNPVSHVGIYVGDGMMIHAYRSGTPVSLDPYDPWGAYNFARRIAG